MSIPVISIRLTAIRQKRHSRYHQRFTLSLQQLMNTSPRRLSPPLYELAVGEDDARLCRDIPESQSWKQPHCGSPTGRPEKEKRGRGRRWSARRSP